jgi:hypothetical protein
MDGLLHTCAFFDSRDQQYEILLPFLLEGWQHGNGLLSILDPDNRDDHLLRLRSRDIVPDDDDRCQVLLFKDTYLKDGFFSPGRMVSMIEEALLKARKAGYSGLRGFGEMHWALTGLPNTEDLIEYESSVNLLAPLITEPLVCVYDVNRFSGRVIMDILSTHPKVIMGGRIYENQYYIPPEQFLGHLSRRRGAISRDKKRPDSYLLD